MKSAASSGTANCGTSGRCITYDAFGRMVESSNQAVWKQWFYTQTGTAQLSGMTLNFAYFATPEGGTAYAVGAGNNLYFLHKDWLGSVRVVSNTGNNTVTADQSFSPYGEVMTSFGSPANQMVVFAGQTANVYNGAFYDTPNRQLSNSAGRWVLPDPARTGWNQYAYATNPNSAVDPSGLAYMDISGNIFGWNPLEMLGEGGGLVGFYGAGGFLYVGTPGPSGFPAGAVGADGLPIGTVTTAQATNDPKVGFGNIVPGSVGGIDTNGTSWSAIDGCGQSGTPCQAVLLGRSSAWSNEISAGSQWQYIVKDRNGDPLSGQGTMSELLFPMITENAGVPAPSSWNMNFSFPFTDTIGASGSHDNLIGADTYIFYEGFQMFTATVNGQTYLLSTTVSQWNIVYNGRLTVSEPIVVHP
jgi:RHS repeat-associated protein